MATRRSNSVTDDLTGAARTHRKGDQLRQLRDLGRNQTGNAVIAVEIERSESSETADLRRQRATDAVVLDIAGIPHPPAAGRRTDVSRNGTAEPNAYRSVSEEK